jgi:hypothetical protein
MYLVLFVEVHAKIETIAFLDERRCHFALARLRKYDMKWYNSFSVRVVRQDGSKYQYWYKARCWEVPDGICTGRQSSIGVKEGATEKNLKISHSPAL